MKKQIIQNAEIINEGQRFTGSVSIVDGKIESIVKGEFTQIEKENSALIDATGKWLIPGVIDDQVHFREPGLTHKGEIYTEAKAAVAGGVTSYMEMPNTNPQTLTLQLLEDKYKRASDVSLANYSFYMGASNDNLDEVLRTDPRKVCGVKVFMGSSTGNMLVDKEEVLSELFRNSSLLIATHNEDEEIIRKNIEYYKSQYGEDVPISAHPLIRTAEACYRSSAKAIELASRFNTRLHILHLSSAREMELFAPGNVKDKKITAEVCVHHLWFNDQDYAKYGTRIKWNPSIKAESDRQGLLEALRTDRIDVVATDHAPHTIEEKTNTYFKAPSGGPLVQHSLVTMLELSRKGEFPVEEVIRKMCHAPAELFRVEKRGFIREGYHADLVLIDPSASWTVQPDNIFYKCKWSPFEGTTFSHQVTHTWVNGNLVYHQGIFNEESRGKRLLFE
ncbi:MAG: dihydroorotase [Bacteroidota bacterium]|nr:dihydroorotase [Bacteroidota bacterium]